MRIIFLLVFVFLFQSCTAQLKIPSDAKINGFKGQVEKMTEMFYYPNTHALKKVYHYDHNGFIVKMEDYNHYYSEQDSLAIGQTTYYTNLEDERSFVTLSARRKDTISRGDYKYLSKSKYTLTVSSSNLFNSTSTFHLNEQQRLIKKESLIKRGPNVKRDNIMEFIYVNDQLSKTIFTSNLTSEVKIEDVLNTKLDKKGNVTFSKYMPENKGVSFKLERIFSYYADKK